MVDINPLVVDLSHHDSVSSFADIYAAGIRGIIHKATQGTSYTDSRYISRKSQALKAGLLWGAYHFGTGEDVVDQANYFLDVIDYDKNTLVALDFENNPSGSTMSVSQARRWMEIIEEKTRQAPALYSGNLIKENLDNDDDGFWKKHRLWLCQYGPRAKVPSIWENYWLWQYTGDGVGPEPHSIDGIDGNQLDINTFDAMPEDLKASWLG